MLFVVHGVDRQETDLRARFIEAHRPYMASHPINIISSGPLLADDSDEMIGSLLIIEAESRDEVDAFLAEEPMAKAGLYESLTVSRWFQRVGSFA